MRASLILLAWTLASASAVRAGTAAREAVAVCHRASLVGAEAGRALVGAGLDLAEAAAAQDPDDPVAHFAVFCNLAKRIQMRGLGLGTLRDLRRAHRALDRCLALAPRYADALAAKGALLYYSPRFAGGDVAAGERLIREALAIDPDNPTRLVLVDLLTYRGAIAEARREAERSLAVAHASEDPDVEAGARALLAHLCAREWPTEVADVLRAAC